MTSTTEVYFLAVLEAVGRFGFFQGLSPWVVDGHLAHLSSHGLPSAFACILISLLIRTYGLGSQTHFTIITSSKSLPRGSWVAQSVEHPTSAQVMISRLVSSSPASGSVRTAQSLDPASDSVSPSLSLSAPPSLCSVCVSLSQK